MINKVILLGIDSLGMNRLVQGGYEFNVAPNLSQLAEENFLCMNAFTHSGPTQLALPGVFTSTRPLDCGGYDFGLTGRPESIVQKFQSNGFTTKGILANVWNSELGGYDVGFDHITLGYDISLIWNQVSRYSRFYMKLKKSGAISVGAFTEILKPHIEAALKCSIKQCEIMKALGGGEQLKDNLYYGFKAHNFEFLAEVFISELTNYHSNQSAYIIDLCSGKFPFRKMILRNSRHFSKLIRMVSYHERLTNRIHNRMLPAGKCIEWLLKNLKTDPKKKEFFWVYLEDLHEMNSSDLKRKLDHKKINKYFESSGINARATFKDSLSNSLDSELRFDACVRYIDEQFGRLMAHLKKHNLLDTTLIVVFADHGIDLHKKFGFGSFEEEYLKVPMIFANPVLGAKKIYDNCALSDIAPTLCDMFNFEREEGYLGSSILSDDVKNRIIFHENLGSGPCDYNFQKLRIAARKDAEMLECVYSTDGKLLESAHRGTENKKKDTVSKLLREQIENRRLTLM